MSKISMLGLRNGPWNKIQFSDCTFGYAGGINIFSILCDYVDDIIHNFM